MAIQSGPSGNPSRTKVRRMAYWVPFDNDGKGGWRFLASDTAHVQQMIVSDPQTGSATFVEGVYESKGYIPGHRIPQDDPRRKLLPTNWREMCEDHKAHAVFEKKTADASA